jgi:hypothetical protein
LLTRRREIVASFLRQIVCPVAIPLKRTTRVRRRRWSEPRCYLFEILCQYSPETSKSPPVRVSWARRDSVSGNPQV